MSEHENCDVEPFKKPVDRKALSTAEAAFLTVAGMGCPNCATRVRNALLRLDGVLYADVFLARGMATVAYRPEQVTTSDLVLAVANAGGGGRHDYQAKVFQTMPAREAFTFAT